MGLVILNDDLLAACTLDVASVLRCEEHTERTEAEWYKIIFSDAETRARIAGELRVRASDVSEPACHLPDLGLPSGCGSDGPPRGGHGSGKDSVGAKRRHDTSPQSVSFAGASGGKDETDLLRREAERLRERCWVRQCVA